MSHSDASTPAGMDPTLLTALQARSDTVIAKLEALTMQFETNRDPRAVFAFVYRSMTLVLRENLSSAGFDDPEWIVSLEEAFAARYLDAMDADGGTSPLAWKVVADAISHGKATVVEELVFSMSAHIIHDLPLALGDVGADPSHIRDYHRMNDVLQDAIDNLQDQVSSRYNPFLGWLDAIGKKHDENLTNYGMRLGRSMAWYNAIRIQEQATRDETLKSMISSVAKVIQKFRHPPTRFLRCLQRVTNLAIRFCRRWPKNSLSPQS